VRTILFRGHAVQTGMMGMKRCIFIILAFLILGAVVNIAVAWGSAMTIDVWSDIWRQRQGVSSDQYPCWGLVVIRRATATYVFRSAISDPQTHGVGWDHRLSAPWWSRARNTPTNEPVDSFVGYAEDARGWPFICVSSSMDATLSSRTWCWTYGNVSWGIPLGGGQGPDAMPRSLPCRPAWAGFAVKTLFYATILWLLPTGLLAFRRRLRRKRGRCPKCGYDLRGDLDAGCPECGWNRQPERAAAPNM
jgi:hypothetical protein